MTPEAGRNHRLVADQVGQRLDLGVIHAQRTPLRQVAPGFVAFGLSPHQNCTDTPLAGTSRAGPTPRPTRPIAGTERNVAHRPLRITGPDTYLTRTPTGPAPPSMS